MVAAKNNQQITFEFTGPQPQKFEARISDALIAVAGNFAKHFGKINPFPHTNLLGKSRAHLHLIALAYVEANSLHDAKRVLDEHKFGRACENVFGQKIPGLENILKKAPAQLFHRATYIQIRHLIKDQNALKILRHSDSVTADLIQTLFNLPHQFRIAGVVKKLRHSSEASIIKQLCTKRDDPHPEAYRNRLAQRLSSIGSTEKFYEIVGDELLDLCGEIPDGPVIDHPNFYPVRNLKQVLHTSRKFRNCLKNYLPEVKNGEISLYVFTRDDESAVIGISPIFGSKGFVREIQGVENSSVRPELLEEIVEILRLNGYVIVRDRRHKDIDDIPRAIHRLSHSSDPQNVEKAAHHLSKCIKENL